MQALRRLGLAGWAEARSAAIPALRASGGVRVSGAAGARAACSGGVRAARIAGLSLRSSASLRAAILALLFAPVAHAQPELLHLRTLAANCAQCHGTEGHTVAGSALPSIAGMPRDYLLTQLHAFKAGTRPSTIMQQLARGYSDAQLEQLAAFFAAQKP